MGKLYMQQKVFSLKDKFTVKDENEQDCYQIEGDFVVIGGKKLHIKTMDDREVAMVQQKLLSLRPKFFVFQNGEQVAEIVKKLSFLKAKYLVDGPGWEVQGRIMDHDYTILDSSGQIVTVHKVWLSWGDSYEIEIADRADETMALAVVLAIDCVLDAESAAASAASN